MIRKIGLWLTLISFIVGSSLIVLSYINMKAQAQIDSEAGVYAYGMAVFVYSVCMILALFISSIVWGIGIAKNVEHESISRLEIWVQRVLTFNTTLIIVLGLLYLEALYL